jgi:Zn-dependent protease with chaperone function
MWWWKYYFMSFMVILLTETLISLIVPSTVVNTLAELVLAFLIWYLLSPYIMILTLRIGEVKDENLLRLASYSAALLGVKRVKVYEIQSSYLNALAFGNVFFNAVALTRSLIEGLNDRELVAVLAHEFAHIKNRDTEIQWFYILAVNIVYALLSFYMLPLGLFALALGIISMFYFHRYLEKKADITAASTTQWISEYLSYALIKIAYLSNTLPTSMLKYFPEFQLLFIKQSLLGSKEREKFFSTHPSLNERLRYLEDISRRWGKNYFM